MWTFLPRMVSSSSDLGPKRKPRLLYLQAGAWGRRPLHLTCAVKRGSRTRPCGSRLVFWWRWRWWQW